MDVDVNVNHVADIHKRKKYMSCDGVKSKKKRTNDQQSKILLLNRSFQHQGDTAPLARGFEDRIEWL